MSDPVSTPCHSTANLLSTFSLNTVTEPSHLVGQANPLNNSNHPEIALHQRADFAGSNLQALPLTAWENSSLLTQSAAGITMQATVQSHHTSSIHFPTAADRLTGQSPNMALVGGVNANGIVRLPRLTGRYQVGTRTYSFTDNQRLEVFTPDPNDRRQVVFQVWYPTDSVEGATRAPYMDWAIARAYGREYAAQIPANLTIRALMSVRTNSFLNTDVSDDRARYPVVMFSPGGFEIPQFYTSQAEQLASQGFIVVTLASTHESHYTLIPGQQNPIPTNPDLIFKAYNPNPNVGRQTGRLMTQVRAADLSFVLDKLTQMNRRDSLLAGHLNLRQVGVFGHSLGGSAAAEALRVDTRFKAGINFDGTIQSRAANVGLRQPFMIVNSTATGADESRQRLFQNLKGDAYSLTIARTDHYNFSDQPLLQSLGLPFTQIGTINPSRGAAIVNKYTLSFFNQYLRGRQSPLLQGVGQPPYVRLQFRPVQVAA